jgi:outer membrane protein TolC
MTALWQSLGWALCFLAILCTRLAAEEPPLSLRDLVDEALQKNPEILAAQAKANAARQRVSQTGSLPDPMLSVGYQNEGLSKYTYGESPDAQWMFSASQTFPFPGKRSLKEDAATLEAESAAAAVDAVRVRIVSRLAESYYNLFLVHKDGELINVRLPLIRKVEELALARYAAGVGPQTDVIMAQTEKYLLMEKQEMNRRRQEALEAMINKTLGREVNRPLGMPVELPPTPYAHTLDELLPNVAENAPELISQKKMLFASERGLQSARRETWPDITLTATYANRAGGYQDMWGLSAGITVPIFYARKQKAGIDEALWNLSTAQREFEASRLALAADIRDNLAMVQAAERLMGLYKNGLIPKTRQDVDAALANYAAGKLEAGTVLVKLKAAFDYELLYWQQYVERENAIARLTALTGAFGKEEER